mmetsp:Transcript_12802/g.42261  ORF Transcript_12802/g.42261 Transcript_12802/m.42261 type:complete len:306 (+) Transcript_12802:190-1107(+)
MNLSVQNVLDGLTEQQWRHYEMLLRFCQPRPDIQISDLLPIEFRSTGDLLAVDTETGHVYELSASGSLKWLSFDYAESYLHSLKGNASEYRVVRIAGGTKKLHRLIATQGVPRNNPNEEDTVDHLNGCRYDNRLCNFEWVPSVENSRRSGMREKGILTSAEWKIYQNLHDFCKPRTCMPISDLLPIGFQGSQLILVDVETGHVYELSEGKPLRWKQYDYAENYFYDTFTGTKKYRQIWLNGKKEYLHRAIATQAVPREYPDRQIEVDHLNACIHDVRLCNLQWVTRKDNLFRKRFSAQLKFIKTS